MIAILSSYLYRGCFPFLALSGRLLLEVPLCLSLIPALFLFLFFPAAPSANIRDVFGIGLDSNQRTSERYPDDIHSDAVAPNEDDPYNVLPDGGASDDWSFDRGTLDGLVSSGSKSKIPVMEKELSIHQRPGSLSIQLSLILGTLLQV